MRHYELVLVLSPVLNQEETSETWERVKEFITNRNAQISFEERWGTRRLAYPIHKGQHHFLEGIYYLTRFSTERPFNQELETFLRVDERVLRSLVVVTGPPKPVPTPAPQPVVEAAVPLETAPATAAAGVVEEAPAAPVAAEAAPTPRRTRRRPPEPAEAAVGAAAEPTAVPEATAAATPPRRTRLRPRAPVETAAGAAAEPTAVPEAAEAAPTPRRTRRRPPEPVEMAEGATASSTEAAAGEPPVSQGEVALREAGPRSGEAPAVGEDAADETAKGEEARGRA